MLGLSLKSSLPSLTTVNAKHSKALMKSPAHILRTPQVPSASRQLRRRSKRRRSIVTWLGFGGFQGFGNVRLRLNAGWNSFCCWKSFGGERPNNQRAPPLFIFLIECFLILSTGSRSANLVEGSGFQGV